LYGVTPTDPVTYLSVIVVIAIVAIGASIGPARRAGRTDPTAVLQSG
jgi:ABC-type lipoprotein release transport system permease subunit